MRRWRFGPYDRPTSSLCATAFSSSFGAQRARGWVYLRRGEESSTDSRRLSYYWVSLFDLETYLAIGVDATVYFVLAIVATALFLIKLGLQFFFGDLDADIDFDDADGAHADSTGAFTFFSILSLLAFFMGVGWMGLACRVSWGFGAAASAAAATGFGVALMMLSSGLMYAVRQMSEEGRYDSATAVGTTGKVYLTIPAKGGGQGQVEVTVSGRRKVMPAISEGESIPAFAAVKVISVRDDEVFIVEQAE